MKPLIFFLSLLAAVCLPPSALASQNWLTIVGDPADATADYIQIDPSAVSGDKGVRTMPVRVSRVHARKSKEGIEFRSFEGVAAIDCRTRAARFLESSFYAEPDFRGQPFRTEVFPATDVRPMAFREIKGNPTQRIVRAACAGNSVSSLK